MGTDKPKKKSAEKPQKSIFVIMPFTCAHERDEEELTAFFEDNIKGPIESNKKFQNRYSVRRSDDTFNITKQIILDLFTADIVICDLSGKDANPNVMYELGIRMALSNGPVILIKEKHADNNVIFDIGGFYTHQYNPNITREVSEHICRKLTAFENGEEVYASPLLEVLGDEVPLIKRLSRNRAAQMIRNLIISLQGFTILQEYEIASCLEISEKDFEPGLLVDHLAANLDKYKNRNWNAISIQFTLPAPVEHFVCSLYLSGIVEERLLEQVNELFFNYYALYSQPTLRNAIRRTKWIQKHLEYTKLIREVAEGLLDYLSASNHDSQTKHVERILEKISK